MTRPTIFGFPASTYVRSVLMALEEKGVAYDVKEVDLGSDAHAVRHPFRKMPVFEHDGVSIFETLAICRYIDETFEGTPLQPADSLGRARMTQWSSAILDYVYPAMVRDYALRYVFALRKGEEPDMAAIAAALPRVKDCLGVLDDALSESAYLAGENMSIADLLLVPIIFYMANTMPERKELMAGRANLSRWFDTMAERPSFAATVPSSS